MKSKKQRRQVVYITCQEREGKKKSNDHRRQFDHRKLSYATPNRRGHGGRLVTSTGWSHMRGRHPHVGACRACSSSFKH